MSQHLTVQPVDDGTDAVLLGFTPACASSPTFEWFDTTTLGAFGVRADGSSYWTTGPVPSSEQAYLTLENGSYFLTRR